MFWVVAVPFVVILTPLAVAFGRARAERAARDDLARRAYEGGCYRGTCGRGNAPGLMHGRMGRN